MKRITNTKNLFRLIYISLLAVLLPHTAWAFSRFEPNTQTGIITAWLAAFFFEATIAVITEKLAERISSTPNYQSGNVFLRKQAYRYLNPYSVALVIAMFVSVLANIAHAVEYGQVLSIFAEWQISPAMYSVAFGAILPVSSLVFAWVLSKEPSTEQRPNTELTKANTTIKELRSQLRDAERRAKDAEDKFGVDGELFVRLFAAEKRERIEAAKEQWPGLPGSSIAIITESTPGYVSDVLREKQNGKVKVKA